MLIWSVAVHWARPQNQDEGYVTLNGASRFAAAAVCQLSAELSLQLWCKVTMTHFHRLLPTRLRLRNSSTPLGGQGDTIGEVTL